ncbi:MAG: extensin family protein, partial [Allosphingosinicella sp.]
MGARVAYLVAGIAVAACLGALVGCGGGGTFNSGQRAPWRAKTEEACLASGAVRASAYVRPMEAINGPGVCGLGRPLRVSGALGGRIGVNPPATIGCPLTAALDRWLSASVQPAASRYFGSRVVEIRQIASY